MIHKQLKYNKTAFKVYNVKVKGLTKPTVNMSN